MGIFSKFKKGFQQGAGALQGTLLHVTGRDKLDADDLAQLERPFCL